MTSGRPSCYPRSKTESCSWLEEGEPVPSELQDGLAKALGLSPVAAGDEQEHFPLRVGEEVSTFLADKRENFGGWTV